MILDISAFIDEQYSLSLIPNNAIIKYLSDEERIHEE